MALIFMSSQKFKVDRERQPCVWEVIYLCILLGTQMLSLFHASDILIISFLHNFKC